MRHDERQIQNSMALDYQGLSLLQHCVGNDCARWHHLFVSEVIIMRNKSHALIPEYSFNPHPVDGCDDCAWLTEAYEEPSVCEECYEDQLKEMYAALEMRV